jgi:hypothetical protein
MSTHAITVIKENGKPLVNLYRQMDGYPDGHGQELYDFLAPVKLVNGIRCGQEDPALFANGAGCLAASLVARFKAAVGEFYLVSSADAWEAEYLYEINVVGNTFGAVVVKKGEAILFEGSLHGFGDWIRKSQGEVTRGGGMGEMKTHTVTWTIQVSGTSPREAAQAALEVMREPGEALFFEIEPFGHEGEGLIECVDLNEWEEGDD